METSSVTEYHVESSTGLYTSSKHTSIDYVMRLVRALEKLDSKNSYKILRFDPYTPLGTVIYTTGDNMPNQTGTFYVLNPKSSRPPTVKYDNEFQARKEAERLAQANPGQEFYVMKALTKSVVNNVITTHV